MIRDLLLLTGLILVIMATTTLVLYFICAAIKEAIGRGLNL